MPLVKRITVMNRLFHDTVELKSISGNTAHFHCSFFKEKVSESERTNIELYRYALEMPVHFQWIHFFTSCLISDLYW